MDSDARRPESQGPRAPASRERPRWQAGGAAGGSQADGRRRRLHVRHGGCRAQSFAGSVASAVPALFPCCETLILKPCKQTCAFSDKHLEVRIHILTLTLDHRIHRKELTAHSHNIHLVESRVREPVRLHSKHLIHNIWSGDFGA